MNFVSVLKIGVGLAFSIAADIAAKKLAEKIETNWAK